MYVRIDNLYVNFTVGLRGKLPVTPHINIYTQDHKFSFKAYLQQSYLILTF